MEVATARREKSTQPFLGVVAAAASTGCASRDKGSGTSKPTFLEINTL